MVSDIFFLGGDKMLEQEIASIANFLYSKCSFELYWSKVPENFKVPSLYFPIPQSFGDTEAVKHFEMTYNLFIKVFQPSTEAAMDSAHNLLMELMLNNSRVPLINQDGTPEGTNLKVKSLQVTELDEGVAQLQISWNSVYRLATLDVEKISEFFLSFTSDK